MLRMGGKLIFLNTKRNSKVTKYARSLLSFAVCSETFLKFEVFTVLELTELQVPSLRSKDCEPY